MSFIDTALKQVNFGGKEYLQFVLSDPNANPTFEAEPLRDGFIKAATRAVIDGSDNSGSEATTKLIAARRHFFDVVRGMTVEGSVYADEFFIQEVKIGIRPHLLVKEDLPQEVREKLCDLFTAYKPAPGDDIEEYAEKQAGLLKVPVGSAIVVGSLVLTRLGERIPDRTLLDNLIKLYQKGGNGRVFPRPGDTDGREFNPAQDGLVLRPHSVIDLDQLPSQQPNEPGQIEIPKGDRKKEEKFIENELDKLEERAKGMDCSKLMPQKHAVARMTYWVESMLVWEPREISGQCFRIVFWVPVLKFRNVDLVLYVEAVNPADILREVIERILQCAINAALDIRVIGTAFINFKAALGVFGALFEACLRYHADPTTCVVATISVITEVDKEWH